ncbi:restriction endonuclease subunit S [Campylobacter upsaliensis]|nr:restriction endonuclease subunit S [Campylobacter upsaliensis]
MRVYKPSGIKWLGEIPQGWEIKKLKYIGEIFGGVTGKTIKDFSKEYKPNFKPYITFTNVCNNAVINPDLMEYVFIDSKEKQNKVLKNDILFLQSSETFEDVGKSAIYLNDDEVYLNTFCKGFRIKREAYSMYLNYLLSSLNYKRYFMSVCSGFTRINLRQEHFLDIPLILPPLQEQKEIAEFLDKKCEKIQNYIDKKQKLITLLQEKKQALINEVVTKGLNPNIEFKNSGIAYLGLIPHHWEVKKLKILFSLGNGLNITKQDFVSYGIPCVSYGEIHSKYPCRLDTSIHKLPYVSETYFADKPQSLLTKGDFVFADTSEDIEGSGNFTSIQSYMPVFAGYHTIILKPKISEINDLYFSFLFDSFGIRSQIRKEVCGVKVFSITKSILKEIQCLLPPLQEQKQIANFLDEKCEKINSAIEKTKRQITLIKEYKNTLINETVCGRINLQKKERI